MWTKNSNPHRNSCREVKFGWKRKQLLEEKIENKWGKEYGNGVACRWCRRWSQVADGCNVVEDGCNAVEDGCNALEDGCNALED